MKKDVRSLAELNEELRELVTEVKLGQVSTKEALDALITTATQLAVRQERLMNGMKLSLSTHQQKRDNGTASAVLLLLGKDIGREVLETQKAFD